MAILMGWFQCLEFLMILLDMWTKEVENVRALSQSIWSLGMLIFLSFYCLREIMEKRSKEQEICFMGFGCRTCL